MLQTAGCDVLWGGCPMITLPLERMASRVAASLCSATGLGKEMIVHSQASLDLHSQFSQLRFQLCFLVVVDGVVCILPCKTNREGLRGVQRTNSQCYQTTYQSMIGYVQSLSVRG